MGHRRWFKVYSERWLRGTMRDTTPEIRGIWVDVLSLASDGYYGEEGIIKFGEGDGLSDTQIARIFNIPLSLWQKAKAFFLSEHMLQPNSDNTLTVVNWTKYQSEYNRQKPYRQKDTEMTQTLVQDTKDTCPIKLTPYEKMR